MTNGELVDPPSGQSLHDSAEAPPPFGPNSPKTNNSKSRTGSIHKGWDILVIVYTRYNARDKL
jgi:hypothetical protein